MKRTFPVATIEAIQDEGSVLVVSFDKILLPPVIPAFLFGLTQSREALNRNALVILQWNRNEGPEWIFEVSATPRDVEVGRHYGMQEMWTPEAYDAVTDLTATWVEAQYPNDGTHEHCLVTFATISAHTGEHAGYVSSEHGWLSERAYQEHIVRDAYGIRARLMQGRVPGKS